VLRQNSRLGRRISTWLTYLLAASVISIVPSALWLPASPANATSGGIAWWWVDQGSNSTTQNVTFPTPANMKNGYYTSCASHLINFQWNSGGPDATTNTSGCTTNSSTATSTNGYTADNFTSYGEGYLKLPNVAAAGEMRPWNLGR